MRVEPPKTLTFQSVEKKSAERREKRRERNCNFLKSYRYMYVT